MARKDPMYSSFFTPIDVDAEDNNKENRSDVGKRKEVIHLDGAGDVSPLTISTGSSLSLSSSFTRKKSRKSPKQASLQRLLFKEQKDDYNSRLKAAFKEATILLVDGDPQTVDKLVAGVNAKYKLVGNRKVAKSTVYCAVKNGLAGKTPPKKGPAPKVPEVLLKAVAAHVEVNQVGDGELRGKDIKRLIGASVAGTVHDGAFKVDTAFKKLCKEYPKSLQAANRMSVEDCRAQWTTHNNLNQWFVDAKKGLDQNWLGHRQRSERRRWHFGIRGRFSWH
jgi:hypothetical protein